MIDLIKAVLYFFARLFAFFCNYENSVKLKYYSNLIFSYWVKASSNCIGNHFIISRPVYFKGLKYIKIGNNFNSNSGLRIECWDRYRNVKFTPSVIIGDNVVMNFNVHIACIDSIYIGNNVLLASNIFITDHFHGDVNKESLEISPIDRALYSKGRVIIEEDVWIGENVSIMPNVTIGKSCIVGANSVVTKSFPAYSIIGGVPAKILN